MSRKRSNAFKMVNGSLLASNLPTQRKLFGLRFSFPENLKWVEPSITEKILSFVKILFSYQGFAFSIPVNK